MNVSNQFFTNTLIVLSLTTSAAYAGEAARHSGESLEHSTQAIGHLSVGTVKAASGVVAIPFGVAGKAGEVSNQASNDLWTFSNEPLEIGDEIVTVGPSPAEMIQQDKDK